MDTAQATQATPSTATATTTTAQWSPSAPPVALSPAAFSLTPSTPTLVEGGQTHSLFRPFPVPQTRKQWFYLLFLQGFGAGIIDGGVNFAVAYAMYHNQSNVRMWVFSDNTIAGDLGVTCIIQCLASMLITSTLVHTDLHHKAIQPLPFVYPHVEHLPDPRVLFDRIFNRKQRKIPADEKKAGADADLSEAEKNAAVAEAVAAMRREYGFSKYYYLMLVRFVFEGTEMNMLAEKVGPRRWGLRFLWTAAQGAAIGIVFGLPLWILAIIILGPIYRGRNIGGLWAPQAIKCVYAAILGWITNPVIATLALGSQADHHLVVVPVDEEAGLIESEAGPEKTGRERETGRIEHETCRRVRRTSRTDREASPGITSSPGAQSSLAIDAIPEDEELQPVISRPSPVLLKPRGSFVDSETSTQRKRSGSAASSLERKRAGSVSGKRPPFTANVSYLSTHSEFATAATGTSAAAAGATLTAATITPGRVRALTVSSYVSSSGPSAAGGSTAGTPSAPTATLPPSPASFTYALGGVGGRAKRVGRSRASTATSTLPASIAATAERRTASTGLGTPGGRSVGTPATPGSFLATSVTTPTRARANSDVAGGALHVTGVERTTAAVVVSDRAPRVEIEEDSSFDVFGRTDVQVPAIALQRPSMDVEREREREERERERREDGR
ncbi:hypothetical protein Q8F55_002018 [Vanrija albida]|uniref:Autophagy-related protein n=1 Tax=Vanrija albida TaxID=181172 RepID=A0ABR3Q8K4_9TREE